MKYHMRDRCFIRDELVGFGANSLSKINNFKTAAT